MAGNTWRLAGKTWRLVGNTWRLAGKTWRQAGKTWRQADQTWRLAGKTWRLCYCNWLILVLLTFGGIGYWLIVEGKLEEDDELAAAPDPREVSIFCHCRAAKKLKKKRYRVWAGRNLQGCWLEIRPNNLAYCMEK